jgi:DNA-binding response OmpR family regulator
MDTPARRVLIVEDELASLFALRRLFESRGWCVECARSVAEALEHLGPEIDWIVLDLVLPDESGEAVLRKVREAHLNCRVAIALGIINPERVVGLLTLQPDLLMTKPIAFEHLFEVCSGTSCTGAPCERARTATLDEVLAGLPRESRQTVVARTM